MKLYGGLDLHSNNSVINIIDEQGKVVFRKRIVNKINQTSIQKLLNLKL